jgi:hypothetical protein
MKKTSVKKKNNELKIEYDFDYKKAKPNRFAKLVRKKTVLIPLEEDVAEVFNTPSEVNGALRAIIHAIPKKFTPKTSKAY